MNFNRIGSIHKVAQTILEDINMKTVSLSLMVSFNVCDLNLITKFVGMFMLPY